MLNRLSIKSLYSLALAEGEGVGTAYEYYAKRLILSRWLKKKERPHRILIAGLPQMYGASMDFLLLAAELNASVTVIDDRKQAIDRCQEALNEVKEYDSFTKLDPQFLLVQDINDPQELSQNFDLALSCEVLQRLSQENQKIYLQNLLQLASQVAIFTPNGDNPDHTNHSGLSGISLERLTALSHGALHPIASEMDGGLDNSGYIDMPPFPPGMTRSEDQRQQATSGKLEALAMWGLGYYAQMERWLPAGWRKRKSHIVYSFLSASPR